MSVEVVPIHRHIIPERAELLLEPTINCTEPNCTSIFKSQSNLTLHLLKVHKKNVKLSFRREQNETLFYYCPEVNCTYNRSKNLDGQKNFFPDLKQLKQHFKKVHKERDFVCGFCSKAFPDEFSLKRHMKVCGQKFYCAICGSSYKTHTSLVYHVKQKRHVFEMSDFDELSEKYFEIVNQDNVLIKRKRCNKAKTHQAIQTDQSKSNKKRPAVSQTKLTLAKTNKRSKVDEKTVVASTSSASVQKLEAASTQTPPIDPEDFFANDPLLSFADNSSQTGCRTNINVTQLSMETQTDIFPLNLDSSFVDKNLQIDSSSNNFHILNDQHEDPLLFNNMHTQTELFEEDCYDIYTQTHFDTDFDYSDYQELVSTETQTYIPLRHNLFANNSSSYTQTSQSIEGGLDQIDTTFSSIHTQT